MKILKVSLMIFCAFICIKGAPIYGSGRNGCGPSKGYELKDDKSEPIKFSSSNSSSDSSKDSSSKGSSSISSSSSNSSSKNK